MKFLNKANTVLGTLVSWIIFCLSFIVPRNKHTWIFIGWHKNPEREVFADNSKYVFLNVANNHKHIRAIWIGDDEKICKVLRSHGYTAYTVRSFWGAYYSLRARYTIIDALMQRSNWRYSGGSKTIQLWHADGIKTLTQTSSWAGKKFSEIFFSPGLLRSYSFLIASSDYIAKHFTAPSFDVSVSKVKITGLPRYDVFFGDVKNAEIDLHADLALKLTEIRKGNPKKIILYAPTFRRGRTLAEQLSPINYRNLNMFLKQHNYYFVVSLHPKFATGNWIPEAAYSNVIFSNPGFDQYPLLPQFDLVVTDYSSICIEFLLLNKPTIFYTYDIDTYRKNEGIAETFWNHMPGPRVSTYGALLDALSSDLTTHTTECESVRKEIFKYFDGNASERVTQEILNDINTNV
jgi:CDP-glycerol glycerophosphotransferase (TagB/SpsB family)